MPVPTMPRKPYRNSLESGLGDVLLPGLAFMGGGGAVPLLVRLDALPECLIFGLPLLGLLLLLLKNSRCFGGGSGGFRRLMPLVGQAPPIAVRAARMASRILVLIAFSIGVSR